MNGKKIKKERSGCFVFYEWIHNQSNGIVCVKRQNNLLTLLTLKNYAQSASRIKDRPADGAVCAEKTGSEDDALTQRNDTGTPDEMVERAIEKYRSVLLEFVTVKEEERRRIWGCDTINDALIMHPDRFIAMFSKNIPKAGEVWIRRDAPRKQIAIILPYEDTRYSTVRYWQIEGGYQYQSREDVYTVFLSEYKNTGKRVDSLFSFLDDVAVAGKEYGVQ